MANEAMTVEKYVVTRNFKWQSHGEVHTHEDFLIGVRYPVVGDGPYCGPNPETVEWTPNVEEASSWCGEHGEEHATMVAKATRDTEAKIKKLSPGQDKKEE